MLTLQDVKNRVQEIENASSDDECAHGMEDDLHRDVLAAIAEGAPNAKELADEALKTSGIRFARWCA